MARAALLMAIALPCVLAENTSHAVLRGGVKSEGGPQYHERDHEALAGMPGNATTQGKALVPSGDVKAEAIVTSALTIGAVLAWLKANAVAIGAAAAAVTAFQGILESGGMIASTLATIFDSLKPSPDFERAVGNFGLPLTVGVINDSPYPVRIAKHEVLKGQDFSFTSESNLLQPGQEAKWEAYSWYFGEVRIAIQLNFEDRVHTHYTVHAAKFRTGSWWCKSLRGEVFRGDWDDVWGHQKALCDVTDGARSGSPYNIAFFVADVPVH